MGFEDTLAARNHCPSADLLAGPEAPGYEECLSVLTESPRDRLENVYHPYGVSPHISSSKRIHRVSLGPTAPQSSGTTSCLPDTSTRGARRGQALEPFVYTSTSLSLEPDFGMNHDCFSNSDPLFHSDHLDTRRPICLDGSQTLIGPSLSPSSRSEVSTTPYTPSFSANLLGACLTPSSTSFDKAPVTYLAVPRAPALTCAECPQVFASTSSLERHSRSHRRFACCQGCTKTFTSRKDCRRHESTIHAGENVQCEICGRRGRKDNMRRHMKRHEGISRDVS